MSRRRIKFVWGAGEVIRGHWRLGLFGFYDRKDGRHDDGLAISVRGVLLWGGGTAALAYLAFATALFWFWQRNPYSLLTFPDALLRPVRRADVRDRQGQAYIAQGRDALRAKRFGEAVALLRQGLAYHPADPTARLTLAQFYVASNQRPLALKTLQDGLGDEFPGRRFLSGLFDLAEQGEDYELIVRLADRYRPRLEGDAAAGERRWLEAREFAALIASARFTEALALAATEEAGNTASEHRVLALLGAGRAADALVALAEWGRRPGADENAVLRLRVRALREAQRLDEMEPLLERLRALAPADPRPLVYGIVQRAMGGREQAAQAAFNDYLFRFGGTTQNVQLVAGPLAEIGELSLLERCAAAATERGYAAEPYQVLLVQAQVQGGNWAAAARTLAAIKPAATGPAAAAAAAAWRDWMRRLLDAAASSGDAAGPALVEFLHARPWPMKIFRQSIEALRRASRLETARDVAALAAGAFPASAWLETQRAEIGRGLAAQAVADAAPAEATTTLPIERVYFERLDRLLESGAWDRADEWLREARTTRPEPRWLGRRDGDLRLAQVRISQGRGEFPALVAAAKFYLNGEPARSRRIVDLAREVYRQGERGTGLVLVKEVLRASPDDPSAQRLLLEWQRASASVPEKK
jgi:hypothetical protein